MTARDMAPTRGSAGASSGLGFMNITITTYR